MNSSCSLVLIEWQDSAQPTPSWRYLSDFEEKSAVLCSSVGWLIHDGDDVKALAPNMGSLTDESSVQVSGVIRIPASCIIKVTELYEPELTSSLSAPSSRPETEQIQREP